MGTEREKTVVCSSWRVSLVGLQVPSKGSRRSGWGLELRKGQDNPVGWEDKHITSPAKVGFVETKRGQLALQD